MEEKTREILNKLDTQLDGVEALCKELHELGVLHSDDDKWNRSIGRLYVRSISKSMLDIDIPSIRKTVQLIEDALNRKISSFPDN